MDIKFTEQLADTLESLIALWGALDDDCDVETDSIDSDIKGAQYEQSQ